MNQLDSFYYENPLLATVLYVFGLLVVIAVAGLCWVAYDAWKATKEAERLRDETPGADIVTEWERDWGK